MATDCIFCKIVAGDLPCKEAYSDDTVFAFEDIAPLAPVHILVIPKQHIDALTTVEAQHEQVLGHMVRVAAVIAKQKKIDAHGYRLSINQGDDAGQMVDHLHLHILGGEQLGKMC